MWSGRLASGSMDLVRFRFTAPVIGLAELYWNGEGEEFAPQRYLLQSPDLRDRRDVAFDLSAVRTWKGTVTNIGLRLVTPPADGQALLRVDGLRYVAPGTMGGGETADVAFDGLSMHAWLTRPGTSMRRRVNAPKGARLRFAAAPWLPDVNSVPIKVVAQTRRATRVLVDRPLAAFAEAPRTRWTAIEVDLSEFAGEPVDLIFEVGSAPSGSMVMWGNPHVVGAAPGTRPNIVLISLDTVRADHLSLYGYRRPTAPHLSEWARKHATVFETAVASAPWTLPSHVSMLTGVDAVHHGINRHGPVPPSLRLLPERFRDAGYTTYANTAGVLLTPELGFAVGFDGFRVRGRMESLPEWDAEISTGITDSIRWLTEHRDERFFFFFHTFEAHSPYQPRQPFFRDFGGDIGALNAGQPVWMGEPNFDVGVRPRYELFHPPTYANGVTYPRRTVGEADRQLVETLYDSGLAYIDDQLNRLLTHLETEGLLDKTIVVITSDHGESFFEHGLVGHSSLYDQDLLVPLVISTPLDPARGRRVSAQVRSVDIAPTLTAFAGLPLLENIDGNSLMGFLRDGTGDARDAWSYALSTVRGVSVRTGRPKQKIIAQDTVFEPFRGQLEAYDLARDPGELRNLAEDTASSRRRLVRETIGSPSSIQIRVTNAGPGQLSGLLGGDVVDPMITSPDLTFACCVVTPKGMQFRAPVGADYTLVLPDRHNGTLRVKLTAGGRLWERFLPLGQLVSPLRVVWDGARWQVTPSPAPKEASWIGIEIRFQQSSVRGIPDDEIRRRLRALGYVR